MNSGCRNDAASRRMQTGQPIGQALGLAADASRRAAVFQWLASAIHPDRTVVVLAGQLLLLSFPGN